MICFVNVEVSISSTQHTIIRHWRIAVKAQTLVSAATARAYVGTLPTVKEGVVAVELLPLKPFTGLEALFASAR